MNIILIRLAFILLFMDKYIKFACLYQIISYIICIKENLHCRKSTTNPIHLKPMKEFSSTVPNFLIPA